MLILCVGPDTFRAQQKAQELRAYFITKYDVNASSVERVDEGKAGIQQIIERTGTASLFAPRRFFSGRDLISECPKALLSPLVRSLANDPENMIVVSVETEAPSSSALKELESKTKVVRYDHPLLQGAAFAKWVSEVAAKFGVSDESVSRKIAAACDGDSWMAAAEILKVASGASFDGEAKSPDQTVYEIADRLLMKRGAFRSFLNDDEQTGAMLNVMLQQSRAMLRVRDNATEGLHPFVVKKMRGAKVEDMERVFGDALVALMSQRSGLGDETEAALLL